VKKRGVDLRPTTDSMVIPAVSRTESREDRRMAGFAGTMSSKLSSISEEL
jgi:hypothetical protein